MSSIQHNWILYIAAFASAFGISLVTTPFARKLSIRLGAIDKPKKRGMHKEPIPRMGGVAIVLGYMITTFIMMLFLEDLRKKEFVGFLVGALIIVAVGVADDIKNIRPKTKLLFQIISALVVIFSGTTINMTTWPFLSFLQPFSIPITLFWIVGITNAVNLIDGVDGLAAGVSSIAAICLMVLCVLSGSELAVVLTATLAGSCFGFLPRNFSPAEVIMGDTGALFLGYVLSVCSIIGLFKSYAVLAVVLSMCALALPIFDTLFAILRRVINGRPISEADRGHLHHRLIDSGYSHRGAVIILYFISIISALIAIFIALRDLRAFLVMGLFLLVFSCMLYVYRKRMR